LQAELTDRQNESRKLQLRLQYQQESQAAQTAEVKALQCESQAREDEVTAKENKIDALQGEIQGLNTRMADLQARAAEEVSRLQTELESRQTEIDRGRKQFADREQHLRDLRIQVESLASRCAQWDRFQQSRGWTLVQAIWRIRMFLIPAGSWREAAARRLWRGLRRVSLVPRNWLGALACKLRNAAADRQRRHREAKERSIGNRCLTNDAESPPAASEALPAAATGTSLPTLSVVRVPPPAASDAPGRLDVVNILTTTFFNMEGKDMFCGGAERYLIELDKLIRSLGYETRIFQCGSAAWTHWYNDLKIEGIAAGGNMLRLNEEFHRRVPAGALTIYFAFHLAYPQAHASSLGISHGVWWDHASFQDAPGQPDLCRKHVLESLSNCQHIVSVDTNTINWVRATDLRQSGKMTYIPNFVDTAVFAPRPESADRPKLVVLYPRRLYGPRGFWLIAEVMPRICERHPNVEFHFVGKGDAAELECVGRLMQDYPGRVRHYYREPEDMHEVYRDADITLIPTVNSEGTSLSCIEALACGNAVIATNVGGLADLIIDSHNGLLVAPESGQIGDALERLIEDRELRLRLQRKAREVAECFSKEVWKKHWLEYLSRLLPPRTTSASEPSRQYCIVHPRTPGIWFDRMKQRPQHLMRAFAELGHQAFFIDDRRADCAAAATEKLGGGKLNVLSSDDDLCATQPVVYIYYAYLYADLARWGKRTVVYDVLDDPKIHEESDRIAKMPADNNFLYFHKKLLAEADLVVTSSRKLFESLRQERPDVLLAPNAACVADFAAGPFSRPDDIAPASIRIIGYFGAISRWFDFDLVEEAARRFPGHQFVLIGPTDVPEKLQGLLGRNANIVHLGVKPYEQLPHYLHYFDVAIIPFLKSEITDAVSPVKLFEYFAGGKPVVTTDLYECAATANVFVAHDASEFVSMIEDAMGRGKDRVFVEELRKIAAANSWQTRARTILDGLDRIGRNSRTQRF
jgi:glycosyltransferase involved in cell wall biosynthesis